MVGLFVIQGCERISLRSILSWGRILRHWRIRSWTPDDEVRLNSTLARQICSSFSKGISPWTISKRRIPRDQTVAGLPRYLEQVIHSGGAYTRVPEKIYILKNVKVFFLSERTPFPYFWDKCSTMREKNCPEFYSRYKPELA